MVTLLKMTTTIIIIVDAAGSKSGKKKANDNKPTTSIEPEATTLSSSDPIESNHGDDDPGEDDDSIVDLELGNPSNILSDDSATARPPPLDEGESDSKVEDLEKQQEPVSVSPKGQHTAAKEEEEEDIAYFGIEAQRDRGTACDICLLEYRVGETVAWSPNLQCSHSYHEDCILDWLVRKPTCPNCRNNYLKG